MENVTSFANYHKWKWNSDLAWQIQTDEFDTYKRGNDWIVGTKKAKKPGKLLITVTLCLCMLVIGCSASEGTPKTPTEDEENTHDFLTDKVSSAENRNQDKEPLRITIIDEFPPESELELHVLKKDRNASEGKEDDIFVGMTNIIDTGSATLYLLQEDGSVDTDKGISIELNTAKFFVPEGGSRCFGVPNFSTEIYGEGEWERRQELDEIDLIGNDCADFNPGIDATRELVNAGYLNGEITKLLDRFPEIKPHERDYTLRLVNAKTTLREDDQTSWWDVDYALYTKADNGEDIMLVYIDICRVTLAQGEVWDWGDTEYRVDAAVENLWRLMEDPVKDQGEVWLQQIQGNSLSDEASVRHFAEEYGASILVPKGADTQVAWEVHRQEMFYYDYLVWKGETADYEVTLAIPLMEKQEEGYYLASRIRKEAEDKSLCEHILSGMMQTFQGVPYLYEVKEGECLSGIAEKYLGTQARYPWLRLYDETTKDTAFFENPNRIYPGEKVRIDSCKEYNGWDALKYVHQ